MSILAHKGLSLISEAYRVAVVVVVVLGPCNIDLGVVEVLLAVGSAKLLTGRVVVEGVLDLIPFQSLVAAVLRQLNLGRAPLAIGRLFPDDDNALPVTVGAN